MADRYNSLIPLLSPISPTSRFAKSPLRRHASPVRVAMICVIVITISGFIFSISSLHQAVQILNQLKEATADTDNMKSSAPGKETLNDKPSISETFYAFFDALRHPITAPSYTDVQGNVFETRGDGPWWTESLGNQILIVDIDTRFPDGKNELWNNGRLDWEHLQEGGNGMLSASQLNHYLYAQIHGYDYRFFRAHEREGLHSTWVKTHALYELLGEYQFAVFLDGDALVTNLDVPLEWMFNRWGITNQTMVAVPLDVRQGGTTGSDSFGRREVNTGFIVVQSLPETFEMLEAWKDCTTESRYPGCGRWKEEWSHEQRAFSEYIRYDPEFTKFPSSIVELSCDDAMGYPGLGDLGWVQDDCKGNFVRHHTINKGLTRRRAELTMLQGIADLAKRDLMRNAVVYKIDEAEREQDRMRNNITVTRFIEEEEQDGNEEESDDDSALVIP